MSVNDIIRTRTVIAFTITAIIFGGWFFVGCGGKPVGKQDYGDTYTDKRDGKVYKLVTIGTQIWFASNLDYAADGSKCYGEGGGVEICDVDTFIEVTLSDTEIQAYCQTYGRLYYWEMAKKACPAGTHLPSDAEWDTLVNYLGGEYPAGTKLRSKTSWNNYPIDCKYFTAQSEEISRGTDEYGFSALPGGSGDSGYYHNAFHYGNAGRSGKWWSATDYKGVTEFKSYTAWYRVIGIDNVTRDGQRKSALHSVRCVAD